MKRKGECQFWHSFLFSMYEMMLSLNIKSGKTLYEQIYEYLKEEILTGKIHCGERLPSTRMLAKSLEISRSTAQLAYEQLLSEGYIEAIPYKGYFVSEIEDLYHLEIEGLQKEESLPQKSLEYSYNFTPNGIDLEHFPYATWRKLNKEVLQEERELFHLGDAKGEEELRRVIATYLYQARGVNVKPKQIIIGAGNDYLLMLLSRMLGTQYRMAMESPTYLHAYHIFEHLGYECCTVSMDKYGMKIEELQKSGADIAYVMPSHQYPLGIVMPIKRRQELLQWAAEKENRYIIEDDYDSEFRYVGKPIPSLQGSDMQQRVIYIGTFSKSIAPAIRISYLVLPKSLLERYEQVGRCFSCTVSKIDQRVLQLFMERGYYERHLNKMRALYKNKHDLLLSYIKRIKCIKKVLGERSGVHILLQFSSGTEEERVAQAQEAGVKVYPLSASCIMEQQNYEPTVILGYATLSEKEIAEAGALLEKAWI